MHCIQLRYRQQSGLCGCRERIFKWLQQNFRMEKAQASEKAGGERYLPVITGLFVAVLLISNIASVKIVQLGWLVFDAGTLIFPLSYIFGDILTEVYGFKRARKVIWTGFAAAILMSLVFAVVSLLPSEASWTGQATYDSILGVVPRLVIASLIAYFAGEFSNSFVLAKMKIWSKG